MFSKHPCFFFLLFILASCSGSPEEVTESAPELELDTTQHITSLIDYRQHPSPISLTDVSSKVFFFAPELDTASMETTGGCDCCSEKVLFLNDSDFISIWPCVADDYISQGTYYMKENGIELRYKGKSVERIYDWDAEMAGIGSSDTRYNVEVKDQEGYTAFIPAWEWNGKLFLTTEENEDGFLYGTEDLETTLNAEIEFLKIDGTWKLLERK